MKPYDTKRLVTLGMLSALAYIAVVIIRIPMVSFLSYEPKDVILAISAFLFGPLSGLCVTVVVSLVEMVTISETGWIGLIMNILSSGMFVGVSALIYKRLHTLKGAVIGLIVGTISMTAMMLLWNYLITPLYMGVERETVAAMLATVFLPFNLVKGTINAALTMLLYKPVAKGLRAAHLAPESKDSEKRHGLSAGVIIVSLLVLATVVLIVLAMQGKLGN